MSLFQMFCAIPALLITIIAIARLNDIKRSQKSKRWWVRRVGLLLTFTAMCLFIGGFFTTFAPYWRPITLACGLWGFALTWGTTPEMPPLWKFISRHDPKP